MPQKHPICLKSNCSNFCHHSTVVGLVFTNFFPGFNIKILTKLSILFLIVLDEEEQKWWVKRSIIFSVIFFSLQNETCSVRSVKNKMYYIREMSLNLKFSPTRKHTALFKSFRLKSEKNKQYFEYCLPLSGAITVEGSPLSDAIPTNTVNIWNLWKISTFRETIWCIRIVPGHLNKYPSKGIKKSRFIRCVTHGSSIEFFLYIYIRELK